MNETTIKIGGLWANTDKNGQQYLSGYLGEAKLLIFTNSYHETGTNQPTHIMYLAPKPAETPAVRGTASGGENGEWRNKAATRNREELGTDNVGGANDGTDFADPFDDDAPAPAPKYRWLRSHKGVVKIEYRGTLDSICRDLKAAGMASRVLPARDGVAALVLSGSPQQTIGTNGEWVEQVVNYHD